MKFIKTFKKSDAGTLLVMLLFLIVVAALVGVWGLSSTRVGFLKAGHFRGTTKLLYQSEEGLQKAVRRIQEISDPTLTDSLYLTSGYGSGLHKDIDFLVDTTRLPTPAVLTAGNHPMNTPCPETFDPAIGLDSNDYSGQGSNVICNFMGPALPNTQIILVRKDDQTEGPKKYGVFLLNVISRDGVGRKKLVQGVVILPYEGDGTTGYSLPAGEKAYLATIVKTTSG